jgi:pimeloyl-ACP methyl ester carboxylesterase
MEKRMQSSKPAIRLIKIAAFVLGGLVVALLVSAAVYVSTWGPTLPSGADETIRQVLQAELSDVVQGETGYAKSGDVEIWYESIEPTGSPKGAVLLIMGIGNDALAWPNYFIQPMVDAGYRVIRHDHRGTGLSDWIEDWDPANPYTLDDMAGDGIAVLDDLGIEKAHIVGVSMGGMIAQQIAIDYPDRVVSLTSMMSTGDASDPYLPRLSAELPIEFAKLGIKYGLLKSEKSTLKMYVASQQLLMGEPPYDLDVQSISEQVLYNIRKRRGYNPQASQQHTAATIASGSRYQDLANLKVPTLIIHGTADPFIPIAHGQKCARTIPDAQTLWIEGMGHDLPRIFVEPMLNKMFEHFQNASAEG